MTALTAEDLRAAIKQDEDLLRALISAHTASLAGLQALFAQIQARRALLALSEQIARAEQGRYVPFR